MASYMYIVVVNSKEEKLWGREGCYWGKRAGE